MSAEKTGQGIDPVKGKIVHPALLDKFVRTPDLPRNDLSLVDFGAGKGTSCADFIALLIQAGYSVAGLALVDADVEVFPDTVGTVTKKPLDSLPIQVVQSSDHVMAGAFISQFKAKFDVALCQLVLHQIGNDNAASYLLYLAYLTLKPNGSLFIVNLHPRYLQYLTEFEPNKFKVTDQSADCVSGMYFFDLDGSQNVKSRAMHIQLGMLLALGFDFDSVTHLVPAALAEENTRYLNLTESSIPMFYILQVRKRADNFVSSINGIVSNIEINDDQWLVVTFLDGDEVRIPSFTGWGEVLPGEYLMLHEVYREEVDALIVNYWIIGLDEKIRGGQLVARNRD